MWNALNRPWKFYLRPTHFWRLKSSPTWVGGTEGSVTWLSQTHLQSSQVFVPPFGTCGQMHVMSISCMTGPSTWNRYFLPLVPLFGRKDCMIADWHWCFLLHSYIVPTSALWVRSFQDAIKSTPPMAPEAAWQALCWCRALNTEPRLGNTTSRWSQTWLSQSETCHCRNWRT